MSLALWDPWISRNLFNRPVFDTPVNDDYVTDNESSFTIEVEMPGMRAEDVTIDVQKGMLLINAERKNGPRTRKVKRAYRLPDTINTDAIEASLTDGILTLTLPKQEPPGTRKILVKPN